MSDRQRRRIIMLPEIISSGPRSGFFVLTRASVHGLRLAATAWKIGVPEPGTEYVS